jgi:hypothetical protein
MTQTMSQNVGLRSKTGPQVIENMVELTGIEPVASSLRTTRVPIASSVFGVA